ncbi:MAG: deoxyguanosinetriphosphate triphosphohydrolase [Armatimonadota bacterium]
MTQTIRERIEKWELETLLPIASISIHSQGRLRPEPLCSVRTEYQRDRDRIIHCKAFRRLKHKTQVFMDPEFDHYRTRLTHTLEVAQISRTIARALKLNEDLTEAIALGHDLGHTPFGHAGEKALDEVKREYIKDGYFRHSEQSLRVVDIIENKGKGLNLTYEVRDGIVKHSKGNSNLSGTADIPKTLEGQVVRISDRIAYINHDIDDAVRAGILKYDDLPKTAIDILGKTHSDRIESMVIDIIENSFGKNIVSMSEKTAIATDMLKDYMFGNIYGKDYPGIIELKQAAENLKELYRYFMDNPDKLPDDFKKNCFESLEELASCVCDYISGMTDRYAVKIYNMHIKKM